MVGSGDGQGGPWEGKREDAADQVDLAVLAQAACKGELGLRSLHIHGVTSLSRGIEVGADMTVFSAGDPGSL